MSRRRRPHARQDSTPPGTAPPEPPSRALGIRWIVSGAAGMLVAVGMLSLGAVIERGMRTALEEQLEGRLLLQARNLALSSAPALLTEYPELTLLPIVREMLAQQPELVSARVVDHRGRVLGDADPRHLGAPDDPLRSDAALAREGLPDGQRLLETRDHVIAEVPVRTAAGEAIGLARVALARSYIATRLERARREQAVVLWFFLGVAVVSALVLMSQLLRPITALREGLERIGRGDFDTPIRLRDRTELGRLAGTVNQMAAALKHAQAEMLERARLAHEMSLARQIQASLMPTADQRYGSVGIYGDHTSANEVGGDYWDILPRRDGRVLIAVADVAGKGLEGCLVMSMLAAVLRALHDRYDSPSDLLAALDDRLLQWMRPGMFVTMFVGFLEPASGRLAWASAGHNPPLVFREREQAVERFETPGIPIGAIRGGAFHETLEDQHLALEPGDVLLGYTDGYSESFDPGGEHPFGMDRVERVFLEAVSGGQERLVSAMREAVHRWRGGRPPSDDQTLLIVVREAAAAGGDCRNGREASIPPREGVRNALPESRDAEGSEAVVRLEEAERHGKSLRLPARLDALLGIRQWVDTVAELRALGEQESHWLVTALYEVCANVVEHGYGNAADRHLDLHWLPAPGTDERSPADAVRPELGRQLGSFIVRDDGTPFRPDDWHPPDYGSPSVRLRGRGLGLDIIHRVMASVAYHPGTPRGNVTLLTFGPRTRETVAEGPSA